jgi:putative methylase
VALEESDTLILKSVPTEANQVHPKTVAVRKRDLAMRLQQVRPYPEPKVALEQYPVPADLAAEILFVACYTHDDIQGKSVADLGTGTGRLALGAAILGAKHVIGIDLDKTSIAIASETSKSSELQVDWILGDIESLRGHIDTVLMNPPFGTKKPHADIKFLKVALMIGRVVYSIHKSSTRNFLVRWLEEHDHNSDRIISTRIEIPHQFHFHRKKTGHVDVDVFRIE